MAPHTPHVRLGQGLRADLRHADRLGLGQRVGLVGDIGSLDRYFFDFGQRLAGGAIEHIYLPGLGTDHHCRHGRTVGLGEIHQAWLNWQVEVPQVIVHGLEYHFSSPVVAFSARTEAPYLWFNAVRSIP